MHRALRHPSFVIGSALTLLLVAAAALSLVWTPWSPYEIDMAEWWEGAPSEPLLASAWHSFLVQVEWILVLKE